MRKLVIPILLSAFLLAVAFFALGAAYGQTDPGQPAVQREFQGENVREAEVSPGGNSPQQPNISFIDSPSATCYQPKPGSDQCYLNWYYMYVDANPNYMISMTLTLNNYGPVARVMGFFQTSMYVPYNMLGQGFQVPCGKKGAGGNPDMGNSYAYVIRARDSSNLGSANYGTAFCPPRAP